MKIFNSISNLGKFLYFLLFCQIAYFIYLFGDAIVKYINGYLSGDELFFKLLFVVLMWLLFSPIWLVLQYHMQPVPEKSQSDLSL